MMNISLQVHEVAWNFSLVGLEVVETLMGEVIVQHQPPKSTRVLRVATALTLTLLSFLFFSPDPSYRIMVDEDRGLLPQSH